MVITGRTLLQDRDERHLVIAIAMGHLDAAILIMGLVRAIDASLRPYIVAGDRFQGRICRSKSCRLDRSET